MEKVNKLKELVLSLEDDAIKFYEKDNKSAGTRVRKTLQEIKGLAQEIRKEISEKRNNMVLLLINKIFVLLFVLSCLNTLRHGILLFLFLISDNEGKYRLNNKQLIILGLSIANVIMSIITGIKL